MAQIKINQKQCNVLHVLSVHKPCRIQLQMKIHIIIFFTLKGAASSLSVYLLYKVHILPLLSFQRRIAGYILTKTRRHLIGLLLLIK